MENEIWEAAEFLGEWDSESLRHKLFNIPREAIDEHSDEPDALLLLGIEISSNLRKVEILIDTAYGRGGDLECEEEIQEAMVLAPEWAKELLQG